MTETQFMNEVEVILDLDKDKLSAIHRAAFPAEYASVRGVHNPTAKRMRLDLITRLYPQQPLKVFYNTSFKGVYPVGTAAIVVAADAERAAMDLQKDLDAQGLKQDELIKPEDMTEVGDVHVPGVVVLLNGDY